MQSTEDVHYYTYVLGSQMILSSSYTVKGMIRFGLIVLENKNLRLVLSRPGELLDITSS